MVKEIPKDRCNHCGGSGYDPIMEEEIVYTRSGDVDVQYTPILCTRCNGTCKESMEKR